MGLANAQSTEFTSKVGEAIGKELAVVGINWNIAPVVDILTDLTEPLDVSRRFSGDAEVVGAQVLAFIKGLKKSGIIACASEALTSTLQEVYRRSINDEPIDLRESALSLEEELLPIRHLINHGSLDCLKLSSIVHDFNNLAQARKSIEFVINVLLRKSLGFDGPIITDCSSLPIDSSACLIHAPLQALLAGSDMVRLSTHYQTQIASINSIHAAIETSLLPISQIKDSATRISVLKSRSNFHAERYALHSLINDHASLALQAYRSSIKALQAEPSPLITLPSTSILVLLTPAVPPWPSARAREQESDPFEPLGRAISHFSPRIRHVPYTLSTGLTSTHVAFLRRADAVILVLTCTSSALVESQADLCKEVAAVLNERQSVLNQRVISIMVGAGGLRDLSMLKSDMERDWWAVECWEWSRAALEAVAEVLVGQQVTSGSLPRR
ncbi:hypothetical protein MMC06_003650 [Schaereria dolodes]|nr:hypothetical protein [Schaereria dolodes]